MMPTLRFNVRDPKVSTAWTTVETIIHNGLTKQDAIIDRTFRLALQPKPKGWTKARWHKTLAMLLRVELFNEQNFRVLPKRYP